MTITLTQTSAKKVAAKASTPQAKHKKKAPAMITKKDSSDEESDADTDKEVGGRTHAALKKRIKDLEAGAEADQHDIGWVDFAFKSVVNAAVKEHKCNKKALMETLFDNMRPKMEDKDGKIAEHVVDVLDVPFIFNGELKRYNKKMDNTLAGKEE